MNKKYYIIMGDIVSSESLDQKKLQRQFATLCKKMNSLLKKDILSPLTITLGDEFQGVAKNLNAGISIILQTQRECIAAAYPFKLRFVLHYGEINTAINPVIAYGMLGPGLAEARNKLEVAKDSRMRFFVSTGKIHNDEAFRNAFIVYQTLIDGWSMERDALLIKSFLTLSDYKLVASKLNKTRSLMWKREISLNIKEFIAQEKLINFIAQC